jgi:DNA-binding LacI/PurR family transcriptional regulator
MAGYKEVAQKLKEKIVSGFYDDFGGRLPIIDDLCLEYEVSRVTMQRTIGVLKKDGLVLTSPKKGISTTRLKRPRTYMIGALLRVGSGVSHLHTQLCAGMERRAAHHNCSIAVRPELNGSIDEAVEAAQQFVDQQNVDGVVIWNTAADHEKIERVIEVLKRGYFPYVLVPEGLLGKEKEHPYLCVDESSIVKDVIEHLTERGHQKIAFASHLALEGGTFIEKRHLLYRVFMESTGLFPLPPIDLTRPYEEILEALDDATAVFCVSDDAMSILVKVAMSTNLRISNDLAIVGYDNTTISKCLDLSSVEQHFDLIGEKAVDMIVAEAEGKKLTDQFVQVRGELVVRGSSSAKTV